MDVGVGSGTSVIEFVEMVAFNVGLGKGGKVIVVALSVDVVAREDPNELLWDQENEGTSADGVEKDADDIALLARVTRALPIVPRVVQPEGGYAE